MGLLEVFRRQCYHGENVNVTVAAYVTTQALLKLYEYFSKLGESVLYYDTDCYLRSEGR